MCQAVHEKQEPPPSPTPIGAVPSSQFSRFKLWVADTVEITGWASLTLIGVGLLMQFFSLWQFDLLFVNLMWGASANNVAFYVSLMTHGYPSYAYYPWTINVWLFPKMTAGLAYDTLLITNASSWFVTATGIYLLVDRLRAYATELRTRGIRLHM